mgnify:FL=1
MDNQKNLILAVVFSIIVLVIFDTFFAPKKPISNQQITDSEVEVQNDEDKFIPNISEKTVQSETPKIKEDRINFNMKRLSGTINLFGATFDDVFLKDYYHSLDKKNDNISILQKENSNAPYFLRMGWASTQNSIDLPDKNSLWTSKKKEYQDGEEIVLFWENKDGLKFKRIISFDDNFMITIEDSVLNESNKTIELTNFTYLQRRNYRPENKFFILHEGPLGVFNDTLKEVSYDEIEEEKEIIETSKNGWIGYTDHYWQVAIFPDTKESFKARFKNLNKSNSIQIDYINEELKVLNPKKQLSTKSYVFVGAKEVPLIDRYIKELGVNKFDLSVDFGWFYFLTKPLFYALNFLSTLVGNFGVGIIILTFFIRILMFPLANKSFKSMNAMRILTPEIQRIKDRYKDDRQKMNQEMFAMYKEKKINPAAGCLPILVQIPIFFALYKVLFVSIEMRHAPFFGWIRDLSAPDPTSLFNLFGLIPWNPPLFLTIGVWPILMGLTMYLQQKINPPPPDPIQAKIFMMLPFVFTFLLATFPSGMVIYWTVNNILSIGQQYILLKKQKKESL